MRGNGIPSAAMNNRNIHRAANFSAGAVRPSTGKTRR
jgi:hypothetical protein